MAYDLKRLIGNVNQDVFGYATADTKATVVAAGYFDESYIALQVNNSILALCSDGVLLLRVSAVDKVAPGSVTVVKTMEG